MAAVQTIPSKQTVIVIGGPTASGKSALSLDIAKKYNGVIINADSMQMYAGLPCLTAQPSDADKQTVPHRLYGSLAPDQPCNAASWRAMAIDEIGRAAALNLTPVIVGGTGLYISTLMHGLSPMPEVPLEVRTAISADMARMGNDAFHAHLAKHDPVMASRLHPGNTQRLIRAMEVLVHTGKSLAHFQALPPQPPPAHLRFVLLTLLPPRDALYARCDGRFEHMMQNGALDEVEAFPRPVPGAMPWPLHKSLGYPELRAYLDGHVTREEAVRAAQQSTRNYAKRQMTWFRNQLDADKVLEKPDAALADGVIGL